MSHTHLSILVTAPHNTAMPGPQTQHKGTGCTAMMKTPQNQDSALTYLLTDAPRARRRVGQARFVGSVTVVTVQLYYEARAHLSYERSKGYTVYLLK